MQTDTVVPVKVTLQQNLPRANPIPDARAVLPQQIPDATQANMVSFPANDGHGIPVGKESIPLFDCCFVAVKEGFSAAESGDKKHE